MKAPVQNFNTLGASLLARTYSHTGDESWRALAEQAMRYTAHYQRPDGSWYYGEPANPPTCCSQAIDILVFFHDRDPAALPWAIKVARWTIANMQDRGGYFYYRRYCSLLVNKTPTLHWGQATMLCALAGLYNST